MAGDAAATSLSGVAVTSFDVLSDATATALTPHAGLVITAAILTLYLKACLHRISKKADLAGLGA